MRKLTILSPQWGLPSRFTNAGLVSQNNFSEQKSHLMKICITASACLVIGLLAPMVYALEKPQRGEGRLSDRKNGGAPAREPADIASKMLSEFDTDGDGMLNIRELTAMFGGMRDRLQPASNGQSRAGQSRAGQGRAKADRRGLGAGSSRDQSLNGRPNEPKLTDASSGKLDNPQGRPSAKFPKQRDRRQSGDPAKGQRPGGTRPESNSSQ